jgi:HD-GYP domain-containing protein (c-di-GMP phosphodiesterase class II)
VEFLSDVLPIVRHEHENWDGSGYPDGLRGMGIPLGARIVMVCDAFHAMTTDRSYRSAMSRERAVAELQEHAGTQFDPLVVDAFLAVLEDEEPEPARALAAG